MTPRLTVQGPAEIERDRRHGARRWSLVRRHYVVWYPPHLPPGSRARLGPFWTVRSALAAATREGLVVTKVWP